MKTETEIKYAPSLLCRIVGHRWWLTEKTYRKKVRAADPNEVREYDLTHHQRTHCERCGVPNPSTSSL